MASEGADPKTFQTWEEAFQYPIPAVRGMERQLRRDIDSTREKLRTLVGASYRDLLTTAESIIEMDSRMHDVETLMGEIGRKCNSRVIDRKAANLKRWNGDVGGKDTARFTLASHLFTLRACPSVLSTLLRSDSLLTASKVLVLSRLLHTKLSKRPQPLPYLETLRARLATLRRRLLAKTEMRFKSLETSRGALVEGMCAYALATSNGPRDVVARFQGLRVEAMGACMDNAGQEGTLMALRLYVKTLQDTRAIVPGQLSLALLQLKAVSIFRSHDVQDLVELGLDVHERWIADDVRGFTPYIRHDELGRPEAERMLETWARGGVAEFLKGLKRRVQDVEEAEDLLGLRREVLEVWLSQRKHGLGVDDGEALDGLRDVFNARSVALISRRGQALKEVGAFIHKAVYEEWQPGVSDRLQSLWAPAMTGMETRNGAKAFRQRLIELSVGTNELLLAISARYENWLKGIEGIENIIQKTKAIKWSDPIDNVDDDDDDTLDDEQVLLSEDDPRLLQDALRQVLDRAFHSLNHIFPSQDSQLSELHSGHQASITLRILREIRSHLPSNFRPDQLGEQSIPILLQHLSKAAITAPVHRCSIRLRKYNKATVLRTRALWEGDPELPILPSSWAYRFLLELTQEMARLGGDVWSPTAVERLKGHVVEQLVRLLQPETPANGLANAQKAAGEDEDNEEGEEANDSKSVVVEAGKDQAEEALANATSTNGTPSSPQATQEKHTQTYFDISYLAIAVAITGSNATGLHSVQASLAEAIELEPQSIERMRKGAAEYWKRTSLLFGLLA